MSNIIFMGTFATGITMVSYKILGRTITDKVLFIESEGVIHAHALAINVIGIGKANDEALECLVEMISDFIQDISVDPEHTIMTRSPLDLYKAWDSIATATTPGAHMTWSRSVIDEFPTEIKEAIAV